MQISDEMVEKAANAIAEKRGYVWPGTFDAEEIKIGRENMRAALEAALSAPSVAMKALEFYANPRNWIDTPSWDGDPDCITPKAIPVTDDGDGARPCDCGDTARAALSALSAQVQDVAGDEEWQIVPKHPTGRMIDAVVSMVDDVAPHPFILNLYRAMLAAAPAKQEER